MFSMLVSPEHGPVPDGHSSVSKSGLVTVVNGSPARLPHIANPLMLV